MFTTRLTRIVLAAGVCCAIGAGAAYAEGTLFLSRDGNSGTSGLYSLDVGDGSATWIGETGVTGATVGLAPSPSFDALYGTKWAGLLEIQTDGSTWASLGGVGNEGLAYDLANDVLYGSINGQFRILDQTDGSVLEALPSPGVDIEGIAYGGGAVYGLARMQSRLYRFDVNTEMWSVVGDTGILWNLAGLAYDPISETLYGKGRQSMNLYAISPADASTTLIGSTGIVEGGGLAFVVPEPATAALLLIGGLAALRRRSEQ